MHNTASRSRPKGGQWKTAVISAAAGGPGEQGSGGLEFYITNGDGTREDRPQGGSAYRCWFQGARIALAMGASACVHCGHMPWPAAEMLQPWTPQRFYACLSPLLGEGEGPYPALLLCMLLQCRTAVRLDATCSWCAPPPLQAAPRGRVQAAVREGAALPQGHAGPHDAGERAEQMGGPAWGMARPARAVRRRVQPADPLWGLHAVGCSAISSVLGCAGAQVSDLDGTMVENGGEAADMTREFCQVGVRGGKGGGRSKAQVAGGLALWCPFAC